MPNIFVDIETVPAYDSGEEFFKVKNAIDSGIVHRDHDDPQIRKIFWKKEMGALNPVEGKIIMITYQVNDGRPWRLAEWKSSEEKILKGFYDVISLNKGNKEDPLNIIGFNITNFDLPFLFYRSQKLKISNGFSGHEPLWLYKYFHKPTVQDILQIHLPLNNWTRYGLNHNAVAQAYNLPTKTERGIVNSDYYYGEEYDKILRYTEDEFIYPELYKKMKRKMVSSEKLQESVEYWIEQYRLEREAESEPEIDMNAVTKQRD